MSVNADQTFSGDSIFENIYVHGKLVTPEEALTIFNSVLIKSGLQVQRGPTTLGTKVEIVGWDLQNGLYDYDGRLGYTGELSVTGNVDVAVGVQTDVIFRVGASGTTLTADVGRGGVGIGSTIPEQRFGCIWKVEKN